MDPLQTLRNLLDEFASVDQNSLEISDLLQDLEGWVTSGGYIPRIHKQGEHTYLIRDYTEDVTIRTVIPGEKDNESEENSN